MHKTIAQTRAFVADVRARALPLDEVDAVICPPFTALCAAREALAGSAIGLGAQNVCWADEGAFTGEISPAMLVECGVAWVVIGHSERRAICSANSTSASTRRRARRSRTGSRRSSRSARRPTSTRPGRRATRCARRCSAAFAGMPAADVARCVVAYEPIWAIGTGNADSPAEANAIMGEIRATLPGLEHARILYGGSMKPDNVAAFLAQPNIDGGLVGGASLEPASFAALLEGARASDAEARVRSCWRSSTAGAPARRRTATRSSPPTCRTGRASLATYPHTLLEASGEAVGLPAGVMGNSEVGHINIGSGRVVPQGVVVIDEEIASGTFGQNATLRACIDHVRANGRHAASARPRVGRQGAQLARSRRSADRRDRRGRRAARDRRLPRRPRHAAALGRRRTSRASSSISPSTTAPARSRRSAAATTRWTATSAGTAPAKRTTRSRTATAEHRYPTAQEALAAAYARGENDEFVAADDRRRAAPDPRRRRVHLLQLPSGPRAAAHARVQRPRVFAVPGAHVRAIFCSRR